MSKARSYVEVASENGYYQESSMMLVFWLYREPHVEPRNLPASTELWVTKNNLSDSYASAIAARKKPKGFPKFQDPRCLKYHVIVDPPVSSSWPSGCHIPYFEQDRYTLAYRQYG